MDSWDYNRDGFDFFSTDDYMLPFERDASTVLIATAAVLVLGAAVYLLRRRRRR